MFGSGHAGPSTTTPTNPAGTVAGTFGPSTELPDPRAGERTAAVDGRPRAAAPSKTPGTNSNAAAATHSASDNRVIAASLCPPAPAGPVNGARALRRSHRRASPRSARIQSRLV